MKKGFKNQFLLPDENVSLSFLVGIDGERYLKLGKTTTPLPDFHSESKPLSLKKTIMKWIHPSS